MASNLRTQLERTTLAPEELISLKSGPEHEEQFRRYTLPQRHRLLEKLRRKDEACVLLTGLPFGMTEKTLRLFMRQFGDIKQCIVHCCPRSGKSKGYGYVHFRYAQVADVAAKTMNNYLLLGNIVKCKLIPGKFIRDKYFQSNDPNFHRRINQSIKKVNSSKSDEKAKKSLGRRRAAALRQLEKMGGAVQPQELQGLADVVIRDAKTSSTKTVSTQKKVVKNSKMVQKRSVKSSRPSSQKQMETDDKENIIKVVSGKSPKKLNSKVKKLPKSITEKKGAGSPGVPKLSKDKPKARRVGKAKTADPATKAASSKATKLLK